MRILFCIPTLGGGGAERQVRLLVKEFARRGVAIGLLTRFEGRDLDELRGHGVACVPIGDIGNHNPRLPLVVAREAAGGKWDIVQSWIAQMDVLVGLCAPLGAFRWVLSERSAPIHYVRGWKNALRKRLGARADLVVANSKSGLAYWRDEPVRKTLIPNAIDFVAIGEKLTAEPTARAGGEPLILSIGRFDRWKNFAPLILAQAALRDQGRPARLVILGDGPLRHSLEKLISDLSLADRVELPGFVPDVRQWLTRADLFVSISLYEGQPNAVLEAAAARVPAVLSGIKEHRELMLGVAMFTDPHDPRDIAGGIARLLDNPALARKYAQAAHARIEGQSVEAVATRYLECYAQLF